MQRIGSRNGDKLRAQHSEFRDNIKQAETDYDTERTTS